MLLMNLFRSKMIRIDKKVWA